jgi:hypothetical protein
MTPPCQNGDHAKCTGWAVLRKEVSAINANYFIKCTCACHKKTQRQLKLKKTKKVIKKKTKQKTKSVKKGKKTKKASRKTVRRSQSRRRR